jgi:hypothetical protein
MASVTTKPVSNIAIAFAGKPTAQYADVSKARNVVDVGNVAGHGQGQPSAHPPDMLLTPPNSISPTLPPHAVRPDRTAPSVAVDSDIDLQDALEHAAAQDHPTALSSAALSGLETKDAITPVMLAKNHLPDILLANGPMAIRHVLSYLTQSVPGFSRIPPAKARRLVVSALESRGGGGPNGDVEFEKVGWGRWDARIKGQPPREGRTPAYTGSVPVPPGAGSATSNNRLSPPASVADSGYAVSSGGLQIPRAMGAARARDLYSGSWASNSMLSSQEEEAEDDAMNMAEHEADKMSLDDENSTRSSATTPDNIPGMQDDLDVTDEEDWAAIGAAALRGGSLPRHRYPHRDYNYLSRSSTARMKASALAKSAPGHHHGQMRPVIKHRTHSTPHHQIPHTARIPSPHIQRRAISSSATATTTAFPAQEISTSHNSTSGFPVSSLRASSAGVNTSHLDTQNNNTSMDMELDVGAQERAAVEALLGLHNIGSM